METEERIVKGNFERIGGKRSSLRLNVRGEKTNIIQVARNFDEAISVVLKILLDKKFNILESLDEIGGVGHRIVHGGEKFKESVIVTEEVIKEIEKCIPLAPLHNPANLIGIRVCSELMPGVPQVAVFDTAFHQTMPAKAYLYGLPISLSASPSFALPAPNQLHTMVLTVPAPLSYTIAEFSTATWLPSGSSSITGRFATTSPVFISRARRFTVS